jgi:KUP system potassium uptake protein
MERPLAQLLDQVASAHLLRAPGCAVFLSANPAGAPAALLANLQYNGVVHEHVLLANVQIEEAPHLPDAGRVTVRPLAHGFFEVIVRFGFMEEPNVPRAMAGAALAETGYDPERSPYFVNRTRVIPTDLPGMAIWREQLYTVMRQNASSAADFFGLPPSRVFEIGTSVEV